MPNNTTRLPISNESMRQGLRNGRIDALLLILGGVFILCNIAVFFGMDTRPTTWLFYLDVRYWSLYIPVILWLTAIWAIVETTNITREHLSSIRALIVTCISISIIFLLRNSLVNASPTPGENSLWFYVVAIVLACCVVRSLFLLYDYRYGEGDIDLEEAKLFWGLSGFILAGLIVAGLMCMISVKIQVYNTVYTESLFKSFRNGFHELFRTGNGGSLAFRMFALLILVSSVAFAYVAGRWLVIMFFKLRNLLRDTVPTFREHPLWFYSGVLLLISIMGAMLIVGINTRPNAWLFFLDMRYWSVYFSIALWITAIWALLESTEITQYFLPLIRILMAIGILLVIVFALRDSLIVTGSTQGNQSLLFSVATVLLACCIIRSLFIFYEYRFGENNIEWEEATWFLGVSGFILVVFAIVGLMHMIPVKIHVYDTIHTMSLYKSCGDGFQEMLRTGNGSFALRMLALSMLVSSVAFVYVVGRWLLILYLKIRSE